MVSDVGCRKPDCVLLVPNWSKQTVFSPCLDDNDNGSPRPFKMQRVFHENGTLNLPIYRCLSRNGQWRNLTCYPLVGCADTDAFLDYLEAAAMQPREDIHYGHPHNDGECSWLGIWSFSYHCLSDFVESSSDEEGVVGLPGGPAIMAAQTHDEHAATSSKVVGRLCVCAFVFNHELPFIVLLCCLLRLWSSSSRQWLGWNSSCSVDRFDFLWM